MQAWPIPPQLTPKQAGALPIDAGTALRGLRDILGLKQGETLLIFGASGGIGHMALQLARRLGARVLAAPWVQRSGKCQADHTTPRSTLADSCVSNGRDASACNSGLHNVTDRTGDFLGMFSLGDQILVCCSSDGAMHAVAREPGQLVLEVR